MNDNYYTISQYIECRTTLLGKIQAVDALISAMELSLLDAIGSAVYDEYRMDDGQMKVQTKYRSVEDVQKGLLGLEQLKQRYVNRYNGRITVMRGGNL